MSELFDEVDEEVRRDQLKRLWEKYSLFIIAAAILIVAGVGGWRGYQYLEAKKAAEAGALFDRAVELSEQTSMPRPKRPSPTRRQGTGRIPCPGTAASGSRTRRPRPAGGSQAYDEIAADRNVGAPSRIWRGSAPPSCCWRVRPIRTCCSGWSRRPPGSTSATARANCWRCPPGAPTTSRRHGSGSTSSPMTGDAAGPAFARRGVAGPLPRWPRVENGRKTELSERPNMRRSQRLIAATMVVALCSVLAGCGFGSSFNPERSARFPRRPRRSHCPAIASRSSPTACLASNRACRRNCTRAHSRPTSSRIDDLYARAQWRRAAPPPEEPKSKQMRSKGKSKQAAVNTAAPRRPQPRQEAKRRSHARGGDDARGRTAGTQARQEAGAPADHSAAAQPCRISTRRPPSPPQIN